MQEKMVPIRCVICEQEKDERLNILGKTICELCEQDLATSNVGDSNYSYLVFRLKALWFSDKDEGIPFIR
ncbi:inhibitor of sigma-G Gin protein [Hazenella coriacea]|uniref:Inhibitor of sigma-G Gin protein n=1 Tax=Hazenella coriacea TaxID=1179467 RepID=A0A4R3L654_9BACL|nr:inhibitor of sigma-G Gin protein [Hazenella coriacea]